MIETLAPVRQAASLSFLCARCRQPMPGPECQCGFVAPFVDGIHDFISHDPACEDLRREIAFWDHSVAEYDTCKLGTVVSVREYFSGLGKHRSAARMLRALRDLELRGKTALEVGGAGHALAMMMRSGCTNLFHLEVSRETQRVAMHNLAALPESDGARVSYLSAPAERIPLPDNSIDFLMAFGTYHHTDRRRSIPEIHRVLKPGGVFFLHETYIGTALLPGKWMTRAIRKPFGFEPGNDNPLSRPDIAFLKRHFPFHRYEIRNVLDAPAFVVRYISPRLAGRMYEAEVDLPVVTPVAVDFLKGILYFSGMKTHRIKHR